MAISKRVQLPSGVIVYYHRIASVIITTNIQTTIEVQSYASKTKREEELDWYAAIAAGENPNPMDIFIETTYYTATYDPKMSIDKAYAWLVENVAEFEGADTA